MLLYLSVNCPQLSTFLRKEHTISLIRSLARNNTSFYFNQIWETAVLQNQRSGVIMWPGGESLRPVRPTYHVRHRSRTPVLEKMETLLRWLDKPRDERPTVMTAYISEVDTAGHEFGPDGKQSKGKRQPNGC